MRQARIRTYKNYIDPDNLSILIRKHGGSAWVEVEGGEEVVKSRKPPTWINRVLRAEGWITLGYQESY